MRLKFWQIRKSPEKHKIFNRILILFFLYPFSNCHRITELYCKAPIPAIIGEYGWLTVKFQCY